MHHGIGHMVGYLLTRHQTWDLPAPSPGTSDLGPNPPIPWTSDLGHTPCYCHLTSGGRHWRQVVCKRAAGILLELYLVSTLTRQKKLQSKLKNEHRQNSICKRLHGTGDTVLSEIKTHFCFVFDKRKSKHRLFGEELCSVASLRITQQAFSIGYVLHHSDTQRSNI